MMGDESRSGGSTGGARLPLAPARAATLGALAAFAHGCAGKKPSPLPAGAPAGPTVLIIRTANAEHRYIPAGGP